MKTLESRRSEICLTFAKKALKNDKFKEWFSVNDEMEPVKKTRYGEAQIIPTLKPVKSYVKSQYNWCVCAGRRPPTTHTEHRLRWSSGPESDPL